MSVSYSDFIEAHQSFWRSSIVQGAQGPGQVLSNYRTRLWWKEVEAEYDSEK